jgi:monoamine oxidase
MNFLGLLCKVRGGQGERFGKGLPPIRMGYWNELEIFRCADGCQKLAEKIAEEITSTDRERKLSPAKLLHRRAVTDINIVFKQGVVLVGSKQVVNDKTGRLDDGLPLMLPYEYVILAIPPSVWTDVQISIDGKRAPPNDEIGKVGMAPAVKFFSDMKDRFWIKEKAAPYGGSLKLGQVWEGTDNQTRVGKQGIVLSVFAGPILPGPRGPRVPTPEEFTNRLRELYPGYIKNRNKVLFSDWPNTPFIKTGYVSPRLGQIFEIGPKLNKPFHGRLFFAGEHTQMDFFGYMEGALRSGNRAAELLMSQSCGLKEPAPASPSSPARIASAAPIREKTAF